MIVDKLSRRELLVGASALSLGATIPLQKPFLIRRPGSFRFVHMTDLHIQPELGAPDGVAKAVKRILSLEKRPDFVLLGGDHVMDVNLCSAERANTQFKLLQEALKPLELPIYSALGNHDIYGWADKSPATESDPLYGKKMFAERFSHRPEYYSFDHKGWHFVVLDSMVAKGRGWSGRIDDAQLTWLQNDLPKLTPTVVMSHVPVFTLCMQYVTGTLAPGSDTLQLANGKEVWEVMSKGNVKAVLQGHTHVVEDCEYMGTHYITGGAVCGEWWKGKRLGRHHEGFMVFDVAHDTFTNQYVPYGWSARS